MHAAPVVDPSNGKIKVNVFLHFAFIPEKMLWAHIFQLPRILFPVFYNAFTLLIIF